MSDNFVNTLVALGVGESITYYAASPQSRDKVKDLAESFSSKYFSVDIQKQGKVRFKLVITRIS